MAKRTKKVGVTGTFNAAYDAEEARLGNALKVVLTKRDKIKGKIHALLLVGLSKSPLGKYLLKSSELELEFVIESDSKYIATFTSLQTTVEMGVPLTVRQRVQAMTLEEQLSKIYADLDALDVEACGDGEYRLTVDRRRLVHEALQASPEHMGQIQKAVLGALDKANKANKKKAK